MSDVMTTALRVEEDEQQYLQSTPDIEVLRTGRSLYFSPTDKSWNREHAIFPARLTEDLLREGHKVLLTPDPLGCSIEVVK